MLKNRRALGYMGAYAMHSWELFAFSSWTIAFLTFSAGLRPGATAGWNLTAIGSLITLTALPASILGNELALRIGRRRTVTIIMWVSAALGCSIGFMAAQPFPIVVALCVAYGLTTTAESATVTAGGKGEEGDGPRAEGGRCALQQAARVRPKELRLSSLAGKEGNFVPIRNAHFEIGSGFSFAPGDCERCNRALGVQQHRENSWTTHRGI